MALASCPRNQITTQDQTLKSLPHGRLFAFQNLWKHCGSKRARNAAAVCAVVIDAPGSARPFATRHDAASRLSKAAVHAHPALRIALPVVIVAIAVMVLHRLASHVAWGDVRADLATASVRDLAVAVRATMASFAALALYDVLAVRIVVPGIVPARIAALAGASGYAISNLLGFSWLTGSTVRYRIYSALGLDAGQVATVIALNWSAFWMGGALIVGLLLAFHPLGLSAVLLLAPALETGLGLSLLLGLGVLLAWLSQGPRRLIPAHADADLRRGFPKS